MNRHYNNFIFWIIGVIINLFFAQFSTHFLAKEKKNLDQSGKFDKLVEAQKSNRYIILREGNKGFALKDIVLNKDSMVLDGYVGWLPTNHRVFENYGDGLNEYDSLRGRYTKLHETHIYVKQLPAINKDALTKICFKIDDIERIVDYDTKTGKGNNALAGVTSNVIAIAIGGAIVVGVVVVVEVIVKVFGGFPFK